MSKSIACRDRRNENVFFFVHRKIALLQRNGIENKISTIFNEPIVEIPNKVRFKWWHNEPRYR